MKPRRTETDKFLGLLILLLHLFIVNTKIIVLFAIRSQAQSSGVTARLLIVVNVGISRMARPAETFGLAV